MRFDTGLFDWSADDFLPAVAHHPAHPDVVLLADGSCMAMLRVPGFPYDLLSPGARNVRRRQLNVLFQNIADDNVQVVVHLVKHQTVPHLLERGFRSDFARRLNRRYRASIDDAALRCEWFLSVIVMPRFAATQPLTRLKRQVASVLRRKRVRPPASATEDALQELEDRVYILLSYLQAAGARRLGLRTQAGRTYSEVGEALRVVLYGEWSEVPHSTAPLGGAVYNRRIICGRRGNEILDFTGSRYSMLLGFKEYTAETATGLLDDLLAAPMPFVWTQSFHFLSRGQASTAMNLRGTRMMNAADNALKQLKALADAADEAASGEVVRGKHHLSLAVFGGSIAEMRTNAGTAAKLLGNMGANPAMEDRASFAAVFSQMPGAMDWLRPRPGRISSKNLSALATFEGVPTGKRHGDWGQAAMRFLTAQGTAYDYCVGVGDVRHTMVIGRSGGGKTLLLTSIAGALEKAIGYTGTLVYFDKDRGAEPMIRACNGYYVPFRRGAASGCAPLVALSNTPPDRSFLELWIENLILLDGLGPILPDDKRRIARGVRRQMKLPPDLRSFAGVREFMGYGDPQGAGHRFEQWCEGGAQGWAFDNREDLVRTDAPLIGFDLTELFADLKVCAATAAYLVHRLNGLIDGRPFAVIWDEMKFSIQVPSFAAIIDDFALTLRKRNGALFVAAQEPSHISRSPIGASLISQCLTKFVLPARNTSEASRADYKAIGLSDPEITMVTEKMPASADRLILLRREDEAVVVRYDLGGFDDEIIVLSGRIETARELDRVRAEVGDDPADWLPAWTDRAHAVMRRLKVEETENA